MKYPLWYLLQYILIKLDAVEPDYEILIMILTALDHNAIIDCSRS